MVGTQASATRLPVAGDVVDGKYRVVRLLGEGGMGIVVEAEHQRLKQSVAIKFLNPELQGHAEVVERFEREARAAATLKSMHVTRVVDVATTESGVPYMVMELLNGKDLEGLRQERGKLPYGEVVDYVLQACAALAEAHAAGIVHRDLKPSNLFVAAQPDGSSIVKVLDFGISKFNEEGASKLTTAGSVMGTALYMSPEQVRAVHSVDGRSDIWSLGVIVFELLTGQVPWDGSATQVAAAIVTEPVPDIRGRCDAPEELVQVVGRMLEKNREARIATIADLAAALAPFARPGLGAEVAEQLARRSGRHIHPPAVRVDKTMPLGVAIPAVTAPPTTTTTASSSGRGLVVGLAAGAVALAVVGVLLIALARRPSGVSPPPMPLVASSAGSVEAVSLPSSAPAMTGSAAAQGSASSAAPTESTAAASPSTPSSTVKLPTRPGGVVKPVSSIAPSAPSGTKPPTKPSAKPTATVNPQFLE